MTASVVARELDHTAGSAVEHARDTRRLVVDPPPGTSTARSVGLAILVALGKRYDAPRREGLHTRSYDLARAWCHGHKINEIHINRSHTLGRSAIHALEQLVEELPAQLHLVDSGEQRPYPVPAAYPHQVMATAESTNGTAFPRVPRRDFASFLSAVAARLPTGDLDVVTSLFDTVHNQALRRFAPIEFSTDWSRQQEAHRQIVATLRNLISPAQHLDEAITRLRAVQAAGFRLGWFIQIAHDHRTAGPLDWTPTIGPLDEKRWMRVASTLHAAAITLTALTQASTVHLNSVTLAHTRDDSVVVDGTRIEVPTWARPPILAQWRWRQINGADPTDRLLGAPGGGETAAALSNLL